VLQRVAACCSVLQRVAACCSVLQRVELIKAQHKCPSLQKQDDELLHRCVAACCCVLQRVAACCSVLQRVAACCALQKHYNELLHRCCSVFQNNYVVRSELTFNNVHQSCHTQAVRL